MLTCTNYLQPEFTWTFDSIGLCKASRARFATSPHVLQLLQTFSVGFAGSMIMGPLYKEKNNKPSKCITTCLSRLILKLVYGASWDRGRCNQTFGARSIGGLIRPRVAVKLYKWCWISYHTSEHWLTLSHDSPTINLSFLVMFKTRTVVFYQV